MANKPERIDTSKLIKPLVDIFASTDPNESEVIHQLNLIDLSPFKDHPFKAYNEDKMAEMVRSVEKSGVIVPIIVRPNPYGNGYEIISGHNRVEASRRCKLATIAAIVKDWDDEQATIFMVDSNFQQREELLPSEKAFGYRMKLEALKRQGNRADLTSGQLDQKLKGKVSRDIIAQESGESSKQIQRYIRLTYLTSELMDYVDAAQMAMGPAVHLSHLKTNEQDIVREAMEREQVFPSIQQAQHMKRLSAEGKLDWSAVNALLTADKPQAQNGKIELNYGDYAKLFPSSSPKQISDLLYKLAVEYHRRMHRDKER